MGICISRASSEIQVNEDGHGENVLFFDEYKVSNGNYNMGSLYSEKGSKDINQDAAVLYKGYGGGEDGAFLGVFDGHGKNGHMVSKIVRNRLPSLVSSQKNALAKTNLAADEENCQKTDGEMVKPSKDFLKWKEAFIRGFKVMDKEIKLQENLDCSCSGTTAVVVIRQGEELVIANLGDSRAVLGTITENKSFMAVQITTDLKPGLPMEADRIRKCNGRVIALKEEPHIHRVWLPHEDSPGLAMSRAFGDFLLKNHGIIALPEVTFRHLTPNDQFLVLASDGVWDVLSNDEVVSIVKQANSEQAAARAVVDASTVAWKTKFPSSNIDDCTVVCHFLQKRIHNVKAEEDSAFTHQ